MHARSWLIFALVMTCLLALVVPASAAEIRGQIKSVDPAAGRFVLTCSAGKEYTFEVKPEAQPALNGLKSGDSVLVQYEVQGGKILALSIDKK